MHRTTRLATLALVAAAAVPVAAPVAGAAVHRPQTLDRLAGSPQVRDVADGTGTLHFATFVKIPTTASGRVDAKVTFAGGQRVGTVRLDGRHGLDFTYAARVPGVRAGSTYTVRFRLHGGTTITRTVKAYDR